MEILGIDIGGSGIKGAPVDVQKGEFTAERFRIPTPNPSVPNAVGDVVAAIAAHFNWQGPIGCTFPAVVKDGVVYTAANVDKSWIGTDGQTLIAQKTNCPVLLLNDADAAGTAEMMFGAGRDQMGTVIVLTFGTGIGSAVYVNGVLVPNTEFGHLALPNGREAEVWASDRTREVDELSWKKWARRVDVYLKYLEFIFTPHLFIIGGGVSKKHEKFLPLLTVQTKVVPAQLFNDAGIVGAAVAARTLIKT